MSLSGSPTSLHADRSSTDEPSAKRISRFNRIKRWNELNKVLLEMKKEGSTDNSTPFSSTNWSVVSPVFLKDLQSYVQSSTDIPEKDFQALETVLTWIYYCYGRSLLEETNSNETKRIHLIAPVLWAVVQLLPDVVVRVEHTMNGNRVYASGRFEFVLTRKVEGVTKRLCIVEAKHDNFEQGLAQNLLGCEVAADLDDSDVVYGIVTNFEKWFFIKDMDDQIFLDENNSINFDINGVPVKDQLKRVVGKIYDLLK
eukprot:jgi/Hompol1/2871/HPOL_006203-RA